MSGNNSKLAMLIDLLKAILETCERLESRVDSILEAEQPKVDLFEK